MKLPYKSYRGVPALAGLCEMEDAARPGLSVEKSVARLKRFHYSFKRLHQIFIARLTAEPVYELKMAFSLHAHLCAEHVTALRKRVSEMREPPLGLDVIPHPALEIYFDELLAAPATGGLLHGIYREALPALENALGGFLADAHPLADHPSRRVCRFAAGEVAEMREFGEKIFLDAEPSWDADEESWRRLLGDCLAAAGGLAGDREESGVAPVRRHSAMPFKFDPVPRRDERFPDPYNMAVNAEAFLYDPSFPAQPKVLMMFYKRLREVDVPEMMASIIHQTTDKPWDYYRDMTRQLWDEARHAMMGEIGFASLDIDWAKNVMVNFTWSMALNTQLTPLERHAVLYFIEQGLMPRSGKRFEWETAVASKDPLCALFQDFDWADEVLHARIGRDWYLKEFSDAKKAVEYGDQCWSKVLMNWESWRTDGKTGHRNWWPDLYRAGCRAWGLEPDPRVLAYCTTYEAVRADLKNLSASA
ncbi:MAG: hypothetical protein QOF48_2401 [Verrucomicrobiota bacterium]|jgi:hypothetical protein